MKIINKKAGNYKPAVKISKTPDIVFPVQKRIRGIKIFSISYSLTGFTDTNDLLSLFLLNSTSPSISAKRV
jgi:hypothetical protein